MKANQKRKLQAFRRALGWVGARPKFSGTPQSGPQLVSTGKKTDAGTATSTELVSAAGVAQQVTTLTAIVTEITTQAGEEERFDRAARGGAADIVRLRDDLVKNQMRHIAIVAETAIPDVVRMTAALRRPGYRDAEGIIASAEAMATATLDYKDVLVKQGLSADFIDQLLAATAAFKGAIDTRGASVGQRHYAREALKELIQRGNAVLDTLSVLVERRYRGDNATLAEWKQVKRAVVVGVRPAADVAPVPVQPAPVQPVPAAMQAAPAAVQVVPAAVQVMPAAAA